jgi:beta-1,3-galactosyltransferase
MLVDELDQCNKMLGKDDNQFLLGSMHSNKSRRSSAVQEGSKTRKYFPFKQNYPFVATLRVGSEGIQMTVDGKHITSFAFREVILFFFFLLISIFSFLRQLHL